MHFRVVFQRLISVCAVLRQEKHPAVVRCQLDSLPLAIGRRTATDIEYDVEHSSSGAANQLCFESGLRLVVHPAYGAFLDTETHVRLNWPELDSVIRELLGAPSAKKMAAVIWARASAAVEANVRVMSPPRNARWKACWIAGSSSTMRSEGMGLVYSPREVS